MSFWLVDIISSVSEHILVWETTSIPIGFSTIIFDNPSGKISAFTRENGLLLRAEGCYMLGSNLDP